MKTSLSVLLIILIISCCVLNVLSVDGVGGFDKQIGPESALLYF